MHLYVAEIQLFENLGYLKMEDAKNLNIEKSAFWVVQMKFMESSCNMIFT